MLARYEKSPYGGVDVWLIMGACCPAAAQTSLLRRVTSRALRRALGILAFVVPFGGLAVGLATGAIHTGL